MEAIQAVNRELLSHMETLGLGDAFLAMAPFIKLYSTYANNFAKAQAALQVENSTWQVTISKRKFESSEFIDSCQTVKILTLITLVI